jgi:hypothetical protein
MDFPLPDPQTVFDLALLDAGCRFIFAPRDLVFFRPRSNLSAF